MQQNALQYQLEVDGVVRAFLYFSVLALIGARRTVSFRRLAPLSMHSNCNQSARRPKSDRCQCPPLARRQAPPNTRPPGELARIVGGAHLAQAKLFPATQSSQEPPDRQHVGQRHFARPGHNRSIARSAAAERQTPVLFIVVGFFCVFVFVARIGGA